MEGEGVGVPYKHSPPIVGVLLKLLLPFRGLIQRVGRKQFRKSLRQLLGIRTQHYSSY